MIDVLSKAVFTGIGILSLTKDKVEEIAQEFVEKGKLSEQEGQKLVGEFMKRSEESKAELKKQVEDNVHKFMEKMDLASKADIAELKEQIAEIRSTLEKKEK